MSHHWRERDITASSPHGREPREPGAHIQGHPLPKQPTVRTLGSNAFKEQASVLRYSFKRLSNAAPEEELEPTPEILTVKNSFLLTAVKLLIVHKFTTEVISPKRSKGIFLQSKPVTKTRKKNVYHWLSGK